MEKDMSSVRPESLTDRELLSGALLVFEPDQGMPIEWQKELIRRLACHVENGVVLVKNHNDAPEQLRLFD
jgi:hypothetical protein